MRTTMLMTTAAAALLVTAGAAPAETLKNAAPEPAPAAQRNAPAEKIAPPMHAGERKAPETTGQGPQALKPGRGDNTELKGTVGAGMRDDRSGAKAGTDTDIKADADAKAKAQSGDKAGSEASSSGRSAASQDNRTVGQGAASGSAKLSGEQRSQITTVITQQDVKRIAPADLDVSIRVGARIPARVTFYPLPSRVVEIYPAWQGYSYILVGSQILIIDPGTHEIVAILVA